MQWFSDFWSWVGFEIAKLRWGQSNLREYILWGLIPVLFLLLYQIIFKRGRRRLHLQPKTVQSYSAIFWPGLDSEFYLLEGKLAERGMVREPGETLSIWLLRATADPTLSAMRDSLQELLRIHYRYRFDSKGLSTIDRETLRRETKVCLVKLAEMKRFK
jgi:hypothetical protein